MHPHEVAASQVELREWLAQSPDRRWLPRLSAVASPNAALLHYVVPRKGLPPAAASSGGFHMEQRRLRVGDNIDDYCPRERRLTTHAVVAMVGDAVKQTRCMTCDAEHVYKGAKVPPRRKAKDAPGILVSAEARVPGTLTLPAAAPPAPSVSAETPIDAGPVEPSEDLPGATAAPKAPDDEGPVHRRLIRAVLPRVEGHVPVRQMPEFTMRQPGVRHPDLVNGNGRRGRDDGTRAAAATPFRGGHGRAFSRPGKGGRPGGSPHGSPHGHGSRRGRHSGGGKKRSR